MNHNADEIKIGRRYRNVTNNIIFTIIGIIEAQAGKAQRVRIQPSNQNYILNVLTSWLLHQLDQGTRVWIDDGVSETVTNPPTTHTYQSDHFLPRQIDHGGCKCDDKILSSFGCQCGAVKPYDQFAALAKVFGR